MRLRAVSTNRLTDHRRVTNDSSRRIPIQILTVDDLAILLFRAQRSVLRVKRLM
jgi:hypothetical protein